MKTFKATLSENSIGVYAISLVDEPAMEGEFVVLSKDEPLKLATANKEQRLLLGLVLEPNKMVYRNNEKYGEFNLYFEKDTVKDLAHNFFDLGLQGNSTLQHDGKPLEDVAFVESWIVEDSQKDKSANYGFNYPPGSWVVMMKVNNNDVWERYVKTGKVRGFSIDSLVKFEEVKYNKMTEKKDNVLLSAINKVGEKLESLISKNKEQVMLEKIPTKDGVDILYEGDLKEDASVYVIGEDGERIPVPTGEYEASDGSIILVEEGKYKGKKSKETETETETENKEEMKEELEKLTKITEATTKVVEELKVELEAIKKTSQEKEEEKTVLLSKVEELQKEVVELSKKEPVTPISTVVSKSYSEMSNVEKAKYNYL